MFSVNKKGDHRRYSISSGAGSRFFASADTVAEAKKVGLQIAKREYGRGKWNVRYITLSIRRQDAPGSMYYGKALWKMYIPVRGTGRRLETNAAEIKQQFGVAPLTWTNR